MGELHDIARRGLNLFNPVAVNRCCQTRPRIWRGITPATLTTSGVTRIAAARRCVIRAKRRIIDLVSGSRVSHTPRPRPCFVDQMEKVPNRLPVRWKDEYGRFWTYDGLHCELEVFNSRGRHLGAANVYTGELIKPARRERRLNV